LHAVGCDWEAFCERHGDFLRCQKWIVLDSPDNIQNTNRQAAQSDYRRYEAGGQPVPSFCLQFFDSIIKP
ncbi:hypothetical protein RRG08_034657, partial [Elysia crispata]